MRSENLVQGGIVPNFVDDFLPPASPSEESFAISRRNGAVAAPPGVSPYLSSEWKRVFDVAAALLSLAFFLPILLIIALAVGLTSRGPVIFRQTRGGANFRPFAILKFRTMFVQRPEDDDRQATRGDARVTRLGYLLRMTSADELPQFFNVLKGDMSLVGPRPHSICHDRIFMGRINGYAKRFQCKPGITGLAQVSGLRGATETDDIMQKRVDADLEYLRTASFLGDVMILVRTVGRVLGCRDAY